MKKVGIVGAGLAGLTCGYRLTQKGLKCIIFEKNVVIGGRVPYCGAVATKKFQPRLISLIEELGLEELKIPLSKKDTGFFTLEGELLGLEKLPFLAMKTFGMKEMMYFMRLNRFINSLKFDVENFDPRLQKIRNISFEEYLKDCPETIRKMVIEPTMVFAFEKDLNKISAEYGLTLMRFANELGSGKAFTFEETNLTAVTNILELKLKERDVQIFTSAQVKKISKGEKGFEIFYWKEGEKMEKVDIVVIATPLNEVEKIFPELKLESNVNYKNSKCIFVEGKLKWPERKFIIGIPENPANLRALFNVFPYIKLVYPLDEEREVDLGKLFREYKIVDEKELEPAVPVIGPNSKVPELKTNIEGVYLCGDFYYYPWLETAVVTAEKVATLLSQEI